MPKPYRKPHTSINRSKLSNKVKVVRKSKALPKFEKPSVNDLKKIYSKFSTCASWQVFDVYAEAIQWYRTVLQYVHNIAYVKLKLGYSVNVSKKLVEFNKAVADLNIAASNESKMVCINKALEAAQFIAKVYAVNCPSGKEYLSKSKASKKKYLSEEKTLTAKYDKYLTLFNQAFGDGLTFKVSKAIDTERKFDHTLNTMFYSVKHIKFMIATFKKDGLLSLTLEEAWHTARAQAFGLKEKNEGLFLTTEPTQALIYKKILLQFSHWAGYSKYAPKSIVKRYNSVPKKVKKLTAA